MTVKQLMDILERCDPNAKVLMAQQENWPFEYSIKGVAMRADLIERRRQENGDYEAPSLRDDQRENDVLLVEDQQLCYGDKLCWEVCKNY